MVAGEPEDLARELREGAPLSSGADCPPSEDFWRAVRGELETPRLDALVDHSLHCRDCGAGLRIAGELTPEDVPELARPVRAWRRPGSVLGAAAVLALAVVLCWGPRGELPDETPGVRGAPTAPLKGEVWRDPRNRSQVLLRWTAYPGASRYRVTVADPTLRVLLERQVSGTTELVVPGPLLEAQPAGTPLIWRVEALLEDGRTIGSEAFELGPR